MNTSKRHRAKDKRHLTKRVIEALPSPPLDGNGKPQQRWVYDETTRHLALCCWSSGSKVWYWVGKYRGRMMRVKLGAWPDIQLGEAREMASERTVKAIKNVDPREDRNINRGEPCWEDVWNAYLTGHAKKEKQPISVKGDEHTWTKHLSQWAYKPISDITPQLVNTFHARFGADYPIGANRIIALISKMWNHGQSQGVKLIPADLPNPAAGVARFPEVKRQRFLTQDELKRFFVELAKEPEDVRHYYLTQTLTGVRKANLLSMRWADVHLEKSLWIIPRSKSGEALGVHLHEFVVDLLRERRRQSTGEYVFPNSRRGGKSPFMTNPWKRFKRVCERAKLADFKPHDLRHTLASWLAMDGESLVIIGRVLGHMHQQTTQRYVHLLHGPIATAANKVAGSMVGLMPVTKPKRSDDGPIGIG